jgi:putative ABC transport system permease protein
MRFAVTAMATGIVFCIVLLMTGFTTHFRTESKRTVQAFGADVWVAKDGKGGPFSGGGSFPAGVADELRAAGAADASPITIAPQTIEVKAHDRIVYIVGVQPGALGSPKLIRGRMVAAPGEAVATRESELGVGQTITVGGRTFTIVGLTDGMTLLGGASMFFIQPSDAQELFFGGQALTSAVLVKGAAAPPPGYKVMTPRDTWIDAMRTTSNVMRTAQYISFLLWIAGTVLMGAVVYVSALERTRDFAVLKALGGSSGRLWGGIVLQSLLVAAFAAAMGSVAAAAVSDKLPARIFIPGAAFFQLAVLAAVAGVLASIGGVRKAVRIDPAIAFASAGG